MAMHLDDAPFLVDENKMPLPWGPFSEADRRNPMPSPEAWAVQQRVRAAVASVGARDSGKSFRTFFGGPPSEHDPSVPEIRDYCARYFAENERLYRVIRYRDRLLRRQALRPSEAAH